MKRFSGAPAPVSPRSNVEIAQDFLDLAFKLESGQTLPVFTRFEGPVTIRVTGDPPATLQPDLDQVLSRLRSEARINIQQVPSTEPANITIEVVARQQIKSAIPGAACFVVPNADSLASFRKNRRAPQFAWTKLRTRQTIGIFIPRDESPQEIRDCLNEEVAQALGPVNDLYRLQDSVFNDDNMHTVLTSFDMLVLRAYYDRSLSSGMSRQQVESRLPGILARINPGGQGFGGAPLGNSPRNWIDTVETALSNGNTGRGQRAARKAVEIAQENNWRDARLAFSLFIDGRTQIGRDNDLAVQRLLQAEDSYRRLGRADLQAAHVNLHLAAFSLSVGQNDVVIDRVDHYLQTVANSQNASLYAKMLMLKAEALDRAGKTAEARSVRLDSLGWARYGFGSERNIQAELRDIALIGKRGPS